MKKVLKKLVARNSSALEESDKSLASVYAVMFGQNGVCAEDTDGFRVCKYTYADVRERIEEVSCALHKKIGVGQYIGLEMENSVDWIVAFWAILRSGNKPYLVNCRQPKDLTNGILKTLSVRYVIGNFETELQAKSILLESLKTEERFEGAFADEIALSTSGTSMRGVVCFYDGAALANQILNVQHFIHRYPEIAKDYRGKIKQLAFLPFYHVFGLIAVYFWFSFFGQTMVFLKNYSADTILKTCKKHEVTHIFAVPLLWHTMEAEVMKTVRARGADAEKKFKKGLKISTAIQNLFPHWGMRFAQKLMGEVTNALFGQSVRFCISGGSYIRKSTLTLFNGLGYNLHNGYGSSELGITSVELRTRPKYKNLGSVGVPFRSVEYKILKNGVLAVRGSSICRKLWVEGKPQPMDGWYNTGDIVTAKNGVYYMQGRAHDMVLGENGENINPDWIEQQFSLPEAENFAVLGLGKTERQELTMVVQFKPYLSVGKKKAMAERIYAKNAELPLPMQIRKFYCTEDAILSANAVKVSRCYLAQKIESGAVTLTAFSDIMRNNSESSSYSEALLQTVVETVAKVLDTEPNKIDPKAHLMLDLGATSIQYFTILTALAEKFSLTADTNESWRYTVDEMCRYIERKL